MEPLETAKHVFSPLLVRFMSGVDHTTRPVKISDSGRIRNELQTMLSQALEYDGDTVRVHFDRLDEQVVPREKQEIIRRVLTWYRAQPSGVVRLAGHRLEPGGDTARRARTARGTRSPQLVSFIGGFMTNRSKSRLLAWFGSTAALVAVATLTPTAQNTSRLRVQSVPEMSGRVIHVDKALLQRERDAVASGQSRNIKRDRAAGRRLPGFLRGHGSRDGGDQPAGSGPRAPRCRVGRQPSVPGLPQWQAGQRSRLAARGAARGASRARVSGGVQRHGAGAARDANLAAHRRARASRRSTGTSC